MSISVQSGPGTLYRYRLVLGWYMYLGHRVLHSTGSQLYVDTVCSNCGEGFSQPPSYLKTHITTRTGEKPHVCSVCGKRFSDLSNMHKHMLTHTQVQ